MGPACLVEEFMHVKKHLSAPCIFRRRDEEGLPVYSPDELNMGRGGETGDCPFDCNCCF